MVLLALWMLMVPGESFPGEVLGLMLKARYAMVTQDHDHALELAEEALRIDGENADAAYLKIEILLDAQSRQLLPEAENQRTLILELKRLTQHFSDDYRFPKELGTYLVTHPRWVEMTGNESPPRYLEDAAADLEAKDPPDLAEMSDVFFYLGRWHLSVDHYFEASRAFARVCEMDPDQHWAWYYSAQTLEASHQLRSALTAYQRFRDMEGMGSWNGKPPVTMDILILEALLEPSSDRMDRLLAFLSQHPPGLGEYYRIAEQFSKAGLYAGGLAVLEDIPRSVRDIHFFNLSLLARMNLHQYPTVLKTARERLAGRIDPNLRRVLVNYAVEAALLAGTFDELIELAGRYSQTPGLMLKIDLFGAFAAALGQNDDSGWQTVRKKHAGTEYIQLLEKETENSGIRGVALKNLVQLYMSYRDWERAKRYVLAAMAEEPDKDALKEDLAVILAVSGHSHEAFSLYEELLDKLPDREDLLNNYGYFLVVSGTELEKAERLISRAVELDPRNSAYLDSMGWVHFHLGNLEEAERYLREALASDPHDPEKLEHLGDLLNAQGRLEEAKQSWSAAMDGTEDRYLILLDKLDPR